MELTFDPNDRGQVGIGTLIVFIAMVLVAAIAAGVLINTAGFLQTQAEDTGTESTEQVANNLNVITTVGDVASSGSTVDTIRLGVQPAAGSDDLNLEEVSIQFVSDESFSNLVHVQESDVDGAGTVFNTEAVTAEDGTDNVMTDNADRYEVVVPLETEKPFTLSGPQASDDSESLAIDEDSNDVVQADNESADRPARFDLVVDSADFDSDAAVAAEFDDISEGDVYNVTNDTTAIGSGSNLENAELFQSVSSPAQLSAANLSAASGDFISPSGERLRFVVFAEEVDEEDLAGFGEPENGVDDFTAEYIDNLDNSDLNELQQGEEAELTFTTETGAQTVAILQMPDSLAGEDEGDTVDL